MSKRRWMRSLAVLIGFGVTVTFGMSAANGRSVRARQAGVAQQCPDNQYPATRDPSNPLALPTAPGTDPLNGAHFFVDGPRHGSAAGAIAMMLHRDPTSFPDSESWATFKASLSTPPLSTMLMADHKLARKVHFLEKIADQPEAQRFSLFSAGGGPGAIFGQVQKIFCHNLTADPGSIPIVSTFFVFPKGNFCPKLKQIRDNGSTFRRQVNELTSSVGRRPAVFLLEVDSVAASSCLDSGALKAWEEDLRFEIDQVSALPHTAVYVEGGFSDANSPAYTARVLNAIGVHKIQGFFTNDTHMNWTSKEINWGDRISAMTHHAHFIVNTAQNGHGPKLNPHPATQGVEDLCNPPGRGLGPRPTTNTGFTHVDAFLWTGPPANSSGSCNGGPPPGVFWPDRAVQLSMLANGKLGPGYPSAPY